MKRKWLLVLIAVFAALACPGVNAYADMGPKPSVTITFRGLEGKRYYVTLLSKTPSTGPWSAGDEDDGDEISRKFRDYRDPEGFYFLNFYKLLEGNAAFAWTYYPPQEFKILIYFPDEDRFCASERSYQRYAFDSSFRVEMPLDAVVIEEGQVTNDNSFLKEALEFLLRVIVTLAAEIGLALLLKYNTGAHLKVIGFTNLATQTFLSAAVVISSYFWGSFSSVFLLFFLEIFIFIIEAVVYVIFFKKINPGKKSSPVSYSFLANLLSFIAGLLIYKLF